MSRNATLLLRWYGTEISSLLNIAKSTKLVGECWSDEIAPTLAPLGEKFPQAQFVVTGVLGPHSNAHGPQRIPAHPHWQAPFGRHRAGDGRSSFSAG